MARCVVVEPFCLGGFSVVDLQCKVLALHMQWVRCLVSMPSSWVSFMVFWLSSVLATLLHAGFCHQMLLLLTFFHLFAVGLVGV